MAFKVLTLSLFMVLASTINCEVDSRASSVKIVEEPKERGDFIVHDTNMDSSMILTIQAAVDAAFGNYPTSLDRVVYVRNFLDSVYNTKYWHVVEDFGSVAYHRFDHIYMRTYRNYQWVHYLIWSTGRF